VHDTGRSFPHLTQISEWLLFAFPQEHLQQSIAKWPLPAESRSFSFVPVSRFSGAARQDGLPVLRGMRRATPLRQMAINKYFIFNNKYEII